MYFEMTEVSCALHQSAVLFQGVDSQLRQFKLKSNACMFLMKGCVTYTFAMSKPLHDKTDGI